MEHINTTHATTCIEQKLALRWGWFMLGSGVIVGFMLMGIFVIIAG